ncbi:MAG: type II toxin-antitoxin system RelE/ParE family toxin [Pseudomonadota bacterium]
MWYDERREGLGSRFLDEVESATVRIDEQAESGSPWLFPGVPPGVRRAQVRGFPYRVVYVIRARVVVVAIAHERRRPDYWEDRLR